MKNKKTLSTNNITALVQAARSKQVNVVSDLHSFLTPEEISLLIGAFGGFLALKTYLNTKPRKCKARKSITVNNTCGAIIVEVHTKRGYLIEICSDGHAVSTRLKKGLPKRGMHKDIL